MRTIVTVDGMRAVHCIRAVQTALTMVPGVQWCDVTVGQVELEHDGGATEAALRAAIGIAGYAVSAVRAERRLPVIGEALAGE
jgi:copper chaperone CopZ